MPVYSVDSDAVLSATAAVRGTADRLQSESTTMLAQLTQLQSVWQGGAAAAFQGVIDEWRSTQRAVEESLASIGQALGAAGNQYAETEQLTASMFR